jgi:lipopolysaccharide export LptBFGC system permease protein LptF
MAFIGMALGIMSPRTQRTWGAGFAATLGLVVFIIYYSIFSIGVALADSGHLQVGVALWAPNVVATSIAVFLVYKITSEKWQSVSGGMQEALSSRWARFRGREDA